MKCQSSVCAAAVAVLVPSLVVAALSPGDVFVTGYNCGAAERDFTFMVLAEVADSETIYFTDKGWTSNSVLHAGEGIIEYTPPAGGLLAGSVVHVTNTATIGSTGADQGTATKSGIFTPAGAGDQLLVYQGTEASPVFISALSWDSTDWVSGDDSNRSLVPPGLQEGVTALHTYADLECGAADLSNGACTNGLSGLRQDIMFNLRKAKNWGFDEADALTLSTQDGHLTIPFAFQGFEGTGNDTWGIVSGGHTSSETGFSDAPCQQRVRSGSYSHQSSNGVSTLQLATLPTVGQSDMAIALHISSTASPGNGADVNDMVEVFVALNGAEFPATADLAVEGYNNARWSYSDVSLSTTVGTPVARTLSGGGDRDDNGDGYSALSIALPNGTTAVGLRVRTTNNSESEIWNIDDISLIATSLRDGSILIIK